MRCIQKRYTVFVYILLGLLSFSTVYATSNNTIEVSTSAAYQVKPGGTLTLWATISNSQIQENASIQVKSLNFESPFKLRISDGNQTRYAASSEVLSLDKDLPSIGKLKGERKRLEEEFAAKARADNLTIEEVQTFLEKQKGLKNAIAQGVETVRVDIPIPFDVPEGQNFTIPLSFLFSSDNTIQSLSTNEITFTVTSNPVSKRAVIIIVDGAKKDDVYQQATNNPNGNTSWLINNGAKFEKALDVFPSITVVNHPSILTGAYPKTHGITGAAVFERTSSSCLYLSTGCITDYYSAIDSFVFNEINDNLQVHTIYEDLPASKTSRVFTEFVDRGADSSDISLTAYGNLYLCKKWPYSKEHFCTVPDTDIIDDVKENSDNRNFDLMVIWFPGTDALSHQLGPAKAYIALSNVDTQIGRLREFLGQAIVDETVFVLTADHGMSAVSQKKTSEEIALVLENAGYSGNSSLDNIRDYFVGGSGGGSEEIYIQSGLSFPNGCSKNDGIGADLDGTWSDLPSKNDIDCAVKAFYAQPYVDLVLARWKGSGGYQVYTGNGNYQDISSYFTGKETQYADAINRINNLDHTLSGDIILLAKYADGYFFSGDDNKGDHGNLNWDDGSIPLIISGPGIKKSYNASSASTVDIAPTIADLLGFSISSRDGRVLEEIKLPPPDTTPPSIFNTYALPASPSAYQAIEVYSDVTDSSGIASASVSYSTDGANWNTIAMTTIGGSTFKTSTPIPGQASGATIRYKVRAADTSGNSAETGTYQIVVGCTDTEAPPAPTLYDPGGTINEGEYLISWSSVSDSGCSGLKQYELQESNSPSFNTVIYYTTQTSYLIAGKGSGTYYYRVRAIDNAGNAGSFSNTADISVEIAPPPAPIPPAPSWSLVDDFASEAGKTTYTYGSAWGDWRYYEYEDGANDYVQGLSSYDARANVGRFYWTQTKGSTGAQYVEKAGSWEFTHPDGEWRVIVNNKGGREEYFGLIFYDSSGRSAEAWQLSYANVGWKMFTWDKSSVYYAALGVNISEIPVSKKINSTVTAQGWVKGLVFAEAGFDWSKVSKVRVRVEKALEDVQYARSIYFDDLAWNMDAYLEAGKYAVAPGESYTLKLNAQNTLAESAQMVLILDGQTQQFNNVAAYATNSLSVTRSKSAPGNYSYQGTVYIYPYSGADMVIRNSNSVTISVIDSTAPSVSISSPASGAVLSTSSVDVAWSGSDSVGISRYEIQLDTGGWVNKGLSTSHVFTGVGDGVHTVYVKAVDAGGNAAIDSRSFSVDATAPSAPSPVASPAGWTNQSYVTISWGSVYDANGIARYEYQIDSTAGAWTSVGNATSFVAPAQATGAHIAYVRAVDNTGNLGSIGSANFYVDTSPPSAPVLNENHTGSNWSSHNSPNFFWSASDEGSGISYYAASLDGAELNLGSAAYYHPTLGDGAHVIELTASDKAGNHASTSASVAVDNTAPVIAVQHPERVSDYEQFEIKANVAEANLKNLTLLLNSLPITYNVSGSVYTSQCLGTFAKGSVLNLSVIVEDRAGNVARKDFGAAVVEGEAKIEAYGKNETVKLALEASWKKAEAKGEFELQEKDEKEKLKAHGKIDAIYKDCSGAFRMFGTARVESAEGREKVKEKVQFSGVITENEIRIRVEGREFAVPAKVNLKEKLEKEEKEKK